MDYFTFNMKDFFIFFYFFLIGSNHTSCFTTLSHLPPPYREAHKAEHTREALSKIIVKHSGKSAKDVNAALERDTYMTASDAKKFGIVDKEITSINEMGPLALPKSAAAGSK